MAEDNVVHLDVPTLIDLPAKRILTAAIKVDLQEAIVAGYDKNGEFYFAATKSSLPDVLFMLEFAKKRTMEMADQ